MKLDRPSRNWTELRGIEQYLVELDRVDRYVTDLDRLLSDWNRIRGHLCSLVVIGGVLAETEVDGAEVNVIEIYRHIYRRRRTARQRGVQWLVGSLLAI